MMLPIMFIIMRWITHVLATGDKITLKFIDNSEVEYDASRKIIRTSGYIIGFMSFYKANTEAIDKNTVTMRCSSKAFSMIYTLINEDNTVIWKDVASEFTTNLICEVLWILEYFMYDNTIKNMLHSRLIEHIIPRIVFSVTDKEQMNEYMKNVDENTKREIENQMGLILLLYLQEYNLGMHKEGDMAVVYKDGGNKNQKEVLESIEFSEVRIHPGGLNGVINEEANTDKNLRLEALLWMFDVCFGVSTLDLSGHVLTDELMGQLSAMENLKTLNLRGCSIKLDNDCDWIGTGFKALEDLNISGVKLEDKFVKLFCGITSLKRLNMEKCFINSKISLEFLKELKDLEELRINGNYLNEDQLNIIFSHESIEMLDMGMCIVDNMYIYGGKIESLEILKTLNGSKVSIKEGEMRITLSEIDDINKWKAYEDRSMFFGNDGEMRISPIEEDDEVDETALEKGANILKETKAWKLSELNGSQVFIKKNREIRIVLPQTSGILEEAKNFTRGKVYFIGKEDGKMNFLDAAKDKGFMKKVEEYNCGQVYFGDKQIDMIFSHKGLKILNMRQCGLESKTIMKVKEKSRLRELDVSNNNMIGEDDMRHIIKECLNLRKLNMSGCRMLITGDFKEDQILRNLEELNIGENKLNHKYIEYIFRHVGLLKLNLEGCGLMEDDLKGINELKNMQELYIGDNFIDKEDLNRIFELKELEALSIASHNLFAEKYKRSINIKGIKKLNKLKMLDLSNNSLYEKDIDEIFELSELRELRMGNYRLGWGKLKNIYKLGNLEKLSTGENEIDENDMKGVTGLKKLKNLNMAGCKIYKKQVFDNIERLKDSLVLLNIENCSISREVCLKKLATLTNLQELRLIHSIHFETMCGILERLTCLRVLYLSIVDSKKFIDCKRFPLTVLFKLEILNLSCIYVSNEFVEGLGVLMNLKELTLTCLNHHSIIESSNLDISAFPRGLRKLEVSGIPNYSLDLDYRRNQASDEIFESLEELCFSYIKNISEVVIDKIRKCTKLRRFKLQMGPSSPFKPRLEGIVGIVTLEKLVLEKVDLNSNDIVRLSCLKQLRRLELLECDLNKECLNEIERLRSIEVLNIKGDLSSHSMNGILVLKNLREFIANEIRFDCDEQGDFKLIKGFEKFEYNKWEVYKKNKRIKRGDADFNVAVVEMRKEATLNNWKGVTTLNGKRIEIDSIIFLAISSKLVFIEDINLYLDNKLKTPKEDIEVLKNCRMLRRIAWEDFKAEVAPPLSTVTKIINDNLFLQMVKISVDELNVELANTLSKCKRLHTIDLYTQKYTNGFFTALLGSPEESMVKTVDFHYFNYEWGKRTRRIIFSNFDYETNREEIIKYIAEEDVDAIIKARNIHFKVCFYTN